MREGPAWHFTCPDGHVFAKVTIINGETEQCESENHDVQCELDASARMLELATTEAT